MQREIRHSTCALDCPDACALLVTVEAGRAVRIRGNPEHPVTQGFLCGKVSRYLERQYHPDRLLYPMRRTGAKGKGKFARVGWDEALDEIADRIKSLAATHGPECVLPYSYAGTMGYVQGSGMDRRFFHRLGASRLDRTICSSAGTAGILEALGARLGTPPELFAESKLIIAWGANVLTTGVHLWPFIVEARRRGARFWVIDPIRTKTASLADRHLAPYPGSDMALAFGLMHVIFREGLEDREYISSYTKGVDSLRARAAEYTPERVERLTGIAAADVETLAREYATTRPATIRLNYGVQRSERGGRAVRAICCLPAITGAWCERGGGLQLTTSGAFVVNRHALERPDLQWTALGRQARLLNMSALGRALTEVTDPPVKALFVYNSNPAAIAPNQNLIRQGLSREDLFTVVADHFQTDTADWADVLLPATTFLEHTDAYFAYGHYFMQLARPVVAPPGEARPNSEIFRALAARLGFGESCFEETDAEVVGALLDTGSPYFSGVTLERLDREHYVRLKVPDAPFASGGFGTADGLCNLSADEYDYTPPSESRLGAEFTGEYPLELVSHKSHDSLNSSFGFRAETHEQTGWLDMHRVDAKRRNIEDGCEVEIFNARGTLRLRARIADTVRPGVVRAPMVRWARKACDGRNVNVLTSDRLTDIGGGPTFYNCLVEVRRCES